MTFEESLEQIAKLNPKLNAFITAATGDPRPATGSIPIAVKDNIVTKDLPTTWARRS